MQTLTLTDAVARKWDCVIVGSSFAAMFFAHGMNRNHKPSILFIERGAFVPLPDQTRDRTLRPYDEFPMDNRSQARKRWVAAKVFGGNSNCWTACTPRFHPNDFRLKTLYGIERDWPLSYDDLEPHYSDVEEMMEISGGGSDHFLPRSRPFPFPPHEPTEADIRLRKHDPIHWFAQPTARSRGGRRTHCCSNSLCQYCPVDAKFTILNSLDHFETPETYFLLNCEVRSVTTTAGRTQGVGVRTKEGAEAEIAADLVALAANPISNVAILLRSGLTNPHLGRGLTEQAACLATYNVPFPNYFGGTKIPGHGYMAYDGPFRRERASVLIEVRNDFEKPRRERGKWLNVMTLKFIAEDLMDERNRVILKEGEPHIEWIGHSEYALSALDEVVAKAANALPFEAELSGPPEMVVTESHILGMTRMAASVDDGVVDPDCQVFEMPGTYAVGASVFPTCSAANPTLTLSALALRAGERV